MVLSCAYLMVNHQQCVAGNVETGLLRAGSTAPNQPQIMTTICGPIVGLGNDSNLRWTPENIPKLP